MNDPRKFVCRLHDNDYEYIGDNLVEAYIPRPALGEVIQFDYDVGRIPYRAFRIVDIVQLVPRRGVDFYLLVEPAKAVAL